MVEGSLKHKTKIGIYWQFFNQLITYGMQFVIGVVMARVLTPEDYGITALPMVFITIAQVFVESGFSSALIRKKDCTEADLATSLYYSTTIGLMCYTILFISAPWIAEFYNTPILTKITRITALIFLFSPLTTPQQVLLNRRMDFKTIARVDISTKFISGIIGIIAAYTGFGLWALVIANLSSTILLFIFNWVTVKWYPKTKWSRESFNYLWDYGSKMLLTFLIDKVYSNITPIIIGKYYCIKELGTYNRALHYAQLPSQQMTGVIRQVTFPVLSKIKDDDKKLEENYRKILKSTTFVVFPVMFLFAALAEPLVILLVTNKWAACIPYIQLMCFWMMWFPLHSLNLNLLLIKGRSDLFLRLEIIKKIIGVAILIITIPIGIIPFLIGSIINSVIALVINTYYTGKLINVNFIRQILDITPTFILCTITAIIVYLITLMFASMWLKLLVGGALGIIIYSGISILFRFPEIEEVKYMINRKNK